MTNRDDVQSCVMCDTGGRVAGLRTITLTRGDATIVIRNAPCDVCEACGHEYLDSGIALELERLAETAIAAGVTYEVRDYRAKVA